jgi:hypothetical protein
MRRPPRPTPRTWLGLLLAALLASCVGPTPTVGSYREHAAGALAQAGEVAAALELVAENAAADHLTTHYATTLVREQEERATYAREAFATRQPPPGTDATRERVMALLDATVAAAEDARILADRGDLTRFGDQRVAYRDLHDRLGVAEANLRDAPAREGTA